MSDPINPYAPPSAESSGSPPWIQVPYDGLWRVKDGRLLMRNGATLPAVCIFGTQPSDDNPISAKPLPSESRWGWAFSFFFCIPALWVFLVYRDLPWTWTAALLVAIFLPRLLIKRARVTAWSSDAVVDRLVKRRAWISGSIVFGIVMLNGVENYFDRNGIGKFSLLVAILLLGVNLFSWLSTRRNPQLLRAEEGWYELRNLLPHTLARFEEIQYQAGVRPAVFAEKRESS
jgi:hypothetical protein